MFKRLLIVPVLLLSLFGCSQVDQNPKTAEQAYDLAILNYDRAFYAQSVEQFKKVIEQHPGTRYSNFAFLKMADALFLMEKYHEADLNYSIFLSNNHHTHLVPYVLSRMVALNFMKNVRGIWLWEGYDYNRDPEPFKKLIDEYQRFYLLYPESAYLLDARPYVGKAKEALASHELMIGDWYFENALYPSAVARYEYLLKHYPQYSKQKEVIEKLIKGYRKNQQLESAMEMQRIYDDKFSAQSEDS